MFQKLPVQPHKIGVIVIDDHLMTCIGIGAMLEPFDDIALLDAADSPEQALALCAALNPDVVLVEPLLKHAVGLQIIATIRRCWPDIGIVALSGVEAIDVIEQALRA
ncbi:MAG: response regulator transcription factor, partial [Chloroflexia bacterium]|nr:response regulator transcription factor [Chloroflexia bacterium]